MTGMHQVLLTLGIVQLLTMGSDSCVMVAGAIAQFATWGMAFGAFLRLKETDEKGAMLGFSLSGIVGGVTEPALYGCGFKYTRCLGAMVAGSYQCDDVCFGRDEYSGHHRICCRRNCQSRLGMRCIGRCICCRCRHRLLLRLYQGAAR